MACCLALSVAMDALLLHHLTTCVNNVEASSQSKQRRLFDGAIRTKATLTGASLLEERGFQELQELSKDMATHVSSLDACMEKYANKFVESMTTKNPGARDRAEKILSLLGRLDRDADLQASREEAERRKDQKDNDDEGGGYDPFAAFNQVN